MSEILLNERRLLGSVAEWAVKQSPYHRPDNLELVLDKLHEQTKTVWEKGKLGFIEFEDGKSLIKFIHDHLRQIPEYLAWNERKNGNDAPFGFVGRGISNEADNDFIDLDALEGNVAESTQR